jgi:hypothetical protein
MGTAEDAQDNARDATPSRGQQLDEAVEKVGATLEDKAGKVADKVADKFIEKTGGSPD